MNKENRCGLPRLIATKYKGKICGNWRDGLEYITYDNISKPTKDIRGRYIFSLIDNGKDVAMVKCKGMAVKDLVYDYAIQLRDK